MRLFDAYIAVDWSAGSKPSSESESKNAIWVGEGFIGDGGKLCTISEVYCRTRRLAESHVRSRLEVHREAQRRVFLGFDFPYGYPAGFAKALDLAGNQSPWRQVWEEYTRLVKDDEKNDNNRFEVANLLNARCGGPTPGPFWGHPDGRQYLTLKSKRKGNHQYPYEVGPHLRLDEKRWTEKWAGGQSVWKLFGDASVVGSQSIVGIPVVSRLRDDPKLARISHVWPFETGFTTNPSREKGPFILHVEIWPGIKSVKDEVEEVFRLDPSVHILDKAQVRAVVRWLSRLDDEGKLGVLFDRPPSLPRETLKACLDEEGWILGGRQSRLK